VGPQWGRGEDKPQEEVEVTETVRQSQEVGTNLAVQRSQLGRGLIEAELPARIPVPMLGILFGSLTGRAACLV
jgi:hypothetical protein